MRFLSPDSYWLQSAHSPLSTYPALTSDQRLDVAIIGGGITGLTAALLLAQAGKKVAVVEAGQIGTGTTGGTSAHLDTLPDQGAHVLIRDFGEEAARQVTRARMEAIDRIEAWTQQCQIDCDFRRVTAQAYTEHEKAIDHLRKEGEAAERLGMKVTLRPSASLPFPTAAAFEIHQQGRFHSINYLRGLAKAVQAAGAAIYENTAAQPPADGTPCTIRAGGWELTASDVIVATHAAFLGISQFDIRQAPYQSYVMAVRVEDDVPDALYWDDEDPYHYTRLAASDDPRLLIIGGADHKTGQADERQQFELLEQYITERFKVLRIERRWSAEFFEPSDGLPYIGRVPSTDHLYIATGYSGTGLTYGTAGGSILADLILGRTSPYEKVFAPNRLKPLAAAKSLISENVNAAKHFIADRFKAEHVESLDVVPHGEGRIVQFENETYAVYRDEYGAVHTMSPECTHAGCYVQWNNAEKTWDCPCHGGRYAATGERIYGPPARPLDAARPKDAGEETVESKRQKE